MFHRWALFVAVAAPLAACADASPLGSNAEQEAPVQFVDPTQDPLAGRIVAMGFSPSSIVDRGDYYIVERDIFFDKDRLRESSGDFRDVQAQWVTDLLPSQPNIANGVKVDLSPISGNSGWLAATRQAMNTWNWISGTKVQLVEGTPADITVYFDSSLGSAYYAIASFPGNGKPGPEIRISTSFNSLAASKKQWLMAHEFGHTLGFRHTNWQGSESQYPYGANQVPGTPQTDAASVMNAGGSLPSWSGFSSFDQVATRWLFPAPAPSVTFGYQGNAPSISWTPVPDVSHYRIIYWYWADDFTYDPTYPGDGYWHPIQWSSDRGTTTSTSFVDVQLTRTWDDSCAPYYQIIPVYPSGKQGSPAQTGIYDNCV